MSDDIDIDKIFSTRFKALQKNLKKPLVFFDLETTGINPNKDRIVEITMIKLTKTKLHDPVVIRMNPGIPIPKGASNVHGIFDDDVKDLPPFSEFASQIVKIMKGSDYSGYNAKKYDVPLLQAELDRHKIDCDLTTNVVVDPYVIMKTMLKYNLGTAYKLYVGKELVDAHSSLADTLAVVQVLSNQLKDHPELPLVVEDLCTDNINTTKKKVRPKKEKVYFLIKEGKTHFNFGKHEGKALDDVPSGYLDWMLKPTTDKFPDEVRKTILEYREKQ